MRFTSNLNVYGDGKWVKKFAFLPKTIIRDEVKSVKVVLWLESYKELYRYYGENTGWCPSGIYMLKGYKDYGRL